MIGPMATIIPNAIAKQAGTYAKSNGPYKQIDRCRAILSRT
jgi:hypothetical protein